MIAALSPSDLKNSWQSSRELAFSVPWTMGTPASIAACLARALSPNKANRDWLGPINSMLFCEHFSANSLFSDKNPYPGCIASQLQSLAMEIILPISK